MDSIKNSSVSYFAYGFVYRSPNYEDRVQIINHSIEQFLNVSCRELYRQIGDLLPFVRAAQFWNLSYKGNILDRDILLKRYVLYNACGLKVPIYIQYTRDRYLHIFGLPTTSKY